MTKRVKLRTIIISRTDNIGDVIFTLPLVKVIKQHFPTAKIILLARNYVKPIATAGTGIDEFLDWDNLKIQSEEKIIAALQNTQTDAIIHAFPNRNIARLAKIAAIPTRISYANKRTKYNFLYCNKLILLGNKRRGHYHETIRTLKLLKKLNIKEKLTLHNLTPFVTLKPFVPLSENTQQLIDSNRFNLILHPGSNGHSQEWPMTFFVELYQLLPKNKFNILLTGSRNEREKFKDNLISRCPEAIDTMGKINLDELITLIATCDGLIAASTGPLHIAASTGIHCLGIFTPRKYIDPRCWQPIGLKAEYLVSKHRCNPCLNKNPKQCECMRLITPTMVRRRIESWKPLP